MTRSLRLCVPHSRSPFLDHSLHKMLTTYQPQTDKDGFPCDDVKVARHRKVWDEKHHLRGMKPNTEYHFAHAKPDENASRAKRLRKYFMSSGQIREKDDVKSHLSMSRSKST